MYSLPAKTAKIVNKEHKTDEITKIDQKANNAKPSTTTNLRTHLCKSLQIHIYILCICSSINMYLSW